jgi:hypothetical protein
VPPNLQLARRSLSAAADVIGLYVFFGSLCVSPVQHQALRRTGFSFLPFSAKYDIIDIREHRKASPNIETRSWQHAGTVDPAELS